MGGRRTAAPPPTPKGSDRRRALLDAAERILIADGHTQLSMRAVAAAADVRLGHLQYYFPARADLIGAVLNRALERSLHRLAELTGSPEGAPLDGEPAQLVRGILAEQDEPELTRLFAEIWALAARDDAIADAVRAFYRDYTAQVAAFLRRHDPGLSDRVCQARAETFVMLVEGAALFRSGIASERSDDTDAELMRMAARLLAPEV
ncbi:TetR/AcrR family transcriptional regulator [Streptomyces piniterrae]|uniref:TetR/AcrR family transcriptional regulator n=2 Tax=Streptomyces piniterrae TaxID=2571125 RepID=A0A4U0NS85_9ACTN|nr:TetR/AcrR family transcriptional regulator [Streptomyces piniterrae]